MRHFCWQWRTFYGMNREDVQTRKSSGSVSGLCNRCSFPQDLTHIFTKSMPNHFIFALIYINVQPRLFDQPQWQICGMTKRYETVDSRSVVEMKGNWPIQCVLVAPPDSAQHNDSLVSRDGPAKEFCQGDPVLEHVRINTFISWTVLSLQLSSECYQQELYNIKGWKVLRTFGAAGL